MSPPRFDWDGAITYGLVAVVIVVSIALAVVDAQQWEKFKAEHNCRKVAEVAPSTSDGYAFNAGKHGTTYITITEPGKTGWLCDDGVTYWR